jgi:hypothetical protein
MDSCSELPAFICENCQLFVGQRAGERTMECHCCGSAMRLDKRAKHPYGELKRRGYSEIRCRIHQ